MEETSSKLLWYTKSDKGVRCYYPVPPIAKINQVINRTVGHSVNKIQFFSYFFFNLPNLLEKLSLR